MGKWKSITEDRDWNNDKISSKEVKNILMFVLKLADESHKFYYNKYGVKRLLSQIIRFSSITILCYIVYSSFSTGISKSSNETIQISINFGLIALASILLLVDRVFGISEGWIRFIQARFEIEKIVADYHAQFLKLFLLKKENETFNETEILQTDLLLNFDKSIRKVIIDETSSWSSNLRTQLNSLTTKIDNDLNVNKQKFEFEQQRRKSEEEKNKKEIELQNIRAILVIEMNLSDIIGGEIKFGNKSTTIIANQKSTVFENIDKGIHSIRALIKTKEKDYSFETAVEIAGGINNYTLK